MSLNKFLKELTNNTPNEGQFKEKNLGKKQRVTRQRRQMQTLSRRNSKYR